MTGGSTRDRSPASSATTMPTSATGARTKSTKGSDRARCPFLAYPAAIAIRLSVASGPGSSAEPTLNGTAETWSASGELAKLAGCFGVLLRRTFHLLGCAWRPGREHRQEPRPGIASEIDFGSRYSKVIRLSQSRRAITPHRVVSPDFLPGGEEISPAYGPSGSVTGRCPGTPE